jgi:hypothetical protein
VAFENHDPDFHGNSYFEHQWDNFPAEVRHDQFAYVQMDAIFDRHMDGDRRADMIEAFGGYLEDFYDIDMDDYWDWEDFRDWYGAA